MRMLCSKQSILGVLSSSNKVRLARFYIISIFIVFFNAFDRFLNLDLCNVLMDSISLSLHNKEKCARG